MGVYNPLVDMPETCDLCFIYGKCGLWLDCENSTERRHPYCPLVEVKAPHGRLVDLDALVHEYYRAPTYPNLCKAINNEPTVLEAEGNKDG